MRSFRYNTLVKVDLLKSLLKNEKGKGKEDG